MWRRLFGKRTAGGGRHSKPVAGHQSGKPGLKHAHAAHSHNNHSGAHAPSLPPHIKLCKQLTDIPRQECVISATDNTLIVQLSHDDAKHLLVMRSGTTACIVADAAWFGTPKSQEKFSYIRQALTPHKLEMDHVYWATTDLIAALAKQKRDPGKGGNLAGSNSSENQHGRTLGEWIEYGLDNRASDLHVEVLEDFAMLRYTVDGELEPMRNGHDGVVVTEVARDVVAYAYNKMIDKKSNTSGLFSSNEYNSATITYDTGVHQVKLRCQFNPTVAGCYDMIARFTPVGDSVPDWTLKTMGYENSQIKLIEDALVELKGAFLISGIPGSGKTSLITLILYMLTKRKELKIVTLEDTVEIRIPGVSHGMIQRVIGDEEESARLYAQAYNAWLRGNPHVVSLGEVRDLASGIATLTYAEVGCLAFGTCHANSALGVYQRLSDPAIGLSLHSLTAPKIVSLIGNQALVPLLCPDCKISIKDMPLPVRTNMQKVGQRFSVNVQNMHFRNVHKKDCPTCHGKGVRGREAVAELIRPDREIRMLIRKGEEDLAEDYWLSQGDGKFDTEDMTGKTVFHHAFLKALQGKIDPSSVERFSRFEHFPVEKPEHQPKKVLYRAQ